MQHVTASLFSEKHCKHYSIVNSTAPCESKIPRTTDFLLYIQQIDTCTWEFGPSLIVIEHIFSLILAAVHHSWGNLKQTQFYVFVLFFYGCIKSRLDSKVNLRNRREFFLLLLVIKNKIWRWRASFVCIAPPGPPCYWRNN